MSTSLSSEETLLLDTLGRFAAGELAPRAAELDEAAAFAGCHLPMLHDLGVMSLNLPAEHGGVGLSARALFQAIEIIAAACASTASMITAHYLATDTILHGAGEDRARMLLSRIIDERMLCAFALTEPGSGSDPGDLRTRAIALPDGWRITGSKQFISNAAAADAIVVLASTAPERAARGISAFFVEPKRTQGIAFGAPERTMGLRGGHVFEIRLDCIVPRDSLIGAEGTGFRAAMRALDNGRLDVAAQATGIAKAALGAAVAYMKERTIAGQPIARFQGLQWMLADMATELAAARALALAAADKRDCGERFSLEASMAKLHASETASRIADKALQIHGGYGYTRAFPLERHLRDLRVFQIYEGSSEIQRNIIARSLLG
jgi:butyryl-CoA dehydrogenase